MSNIYSIHLNDLETILMYAVKQPVQSIDAWKKQLSLLGVCRLWTRLLYPVVFRTVYIEFGKCINGSQSREWNTNIDCIASRGCHYVVNTLRINATGYFDAARSASQLTNILKFNTANWSNIRTLYILINYIVTPSAHKKYFELESNEISALTHKFIRYMPSIKELLLYNLGSPGISSSVIKILASAYAPQLQQLSIFTPFSTGQLHFTAQLTCLCINTWPLHISILAGLNVYARTLQRLSLLSLSTNYDWNPFYDYITPGHIYFDSLQLLEIRYILEHYSNTVHPLSYAPSCSSMLHFPKLQVLVLRDCPPKCILLSAKFPTHYLTRVMIEDRSLEVMYEKLLTIKAQQLNVIIGIDSTYNSTYYLAMNSVISKLAHFTRRRLQVIKWNLAPDYEKLQLNYLDDMSFYFTTPIQILSILPRAPRLSELSVTRLDFGDDCSLSAIEHAADKENNQAHLKLRSIHIKLIEGNSPQSAALAFIQNLITRATNLRELAVPADYKDDVIFIIGRMKQSIPHLENIVVASKAN